MCGTLRQHATQIRSASDIPRACSPDGLLEEMNRLQCNIEEAHSMIDELEARLQSILVPPPTTGESQVNRNEVQPAVAHLVNVAKLHNSSVLAIQNKLKFLIGRINL